MTRTWVVQVVAATFVANAGAEEKGKVGKMLIEVPMADLVEAYSNAIAADEKYKGKLIVVRGKVDRIEKIPALKDKVCLIMETVQANLFVFDEQSAKELNKLKRGDDVLVMGTCTGKTKDILAFVGCQVATAKYADKLVGEWSDGKMSYTVEKSGKVKMGSLTATISDSLLVVDLYGLTYRIQNLTEDTLVLINITKAKVTGDRKVLKRK